MGEISLPILHSALWWINVVESDVLKYTVNLSSDETNYYCQLSYFYNSFLLLEFNFVFFVLLFLSLVGSTPEPEVVGGRVRSVSHPEKKKK